MVLHDFAPTENGWAKRHVGCFVDHTEATYLRCPGDLVGHLPRPESAAPSQPRDAAGPEGVRADTAPCQRKGSVTRRADTHPTTPHTRQSRVAS